MGCSGEAWRTRRRAVVAAVVGIAAGLGTGAARAQTFPQDAQWVPLTCNGQVVTDAVGEVRPPAIDAVGDAAALPAVLGIRRWRPACALLGILEPDPESLRGSPGDPRRPAR